MRSLKWILVGVTGLAFAMPLSSAQESGVNPVDLTAASTPGLWFGKLKPGPAEFDGIPFVLMDGRVSVPAGQRKRIDFPPATCAGVHFLHFTENAGASIGSYALLYADGQRAEIPLGGGLSIQDWWKPGPLAFAAQAHLDALPRDPNPPQPIAFWRFSARNPRPDVPVTALEVVNSDAAVTINLLAVTFTGACEEKIGSVPVWVNGMDEEQFLLAVLAQPGAVAGKENACERLKVIGTLTSVPPLAACLTDEKLSHAARLALAAMPYPEARTALRDALNSTAGATRAGIIESLGALRDAESAPLLTADLRNAEPVVAMSAALALGRIGGPEAIDALKTAARDGQGRFKMVALDALLSCAEKLCGEHDADALALYTDIYKQWGQGYVGTAAYAGMIRTSGNNASNLISEALLGNDAVLWNAALPAAREVPGAGVTQACASVLQRVPKEVLLPIVEALAQRGDKAAAPALAAVVENEDPAIAFAAIKALALVGNESSVAVLVKAAAHAEEANRGAAMQALLQLNDPGVSAAMVSRLEGADPAETAVLAQAMGQRKDTTLGLALRNLIQSQDAGVRTAAVQALAEVGETTDAEFLCQVVERATDDKERSAAKRALVTLGERVSSPPEFVSPILARLNKEDAALRCAMLDVCGKLRNAELLQALDKATNDTNADVKDAAIRALAGSEDPAALPHLLALMDKTSDLKQQVLVFRGIARLASNSKDVEENVREDALTRALAKATRPEEKKLFLGALGGCPTIGALKTVEPLLQSDEVAAEAVTAWGQIAKAILPKYPDDVRNAAPSVLARAQAIAVSKAAMGPLMDVARALAATPVPGDKVHFEHVVVDPQFRSEGVAVADVNRDGLNDIMVGDLWYAAPDWQAQEIRPAQTYDPNTGYSQCFAAFAEDVDVDGWPDCLVIGFPGAPAHWYRNPGEKGGHWEQFLFATAACGETVLYDDLLGDGKPVPIFALNNRISWFRPGQDRRAPWMVYPMLQQMDAFAQFGHGLGIGDVNNDGRMDILVTEGWWEGPTDPTRPDWGWHPASLGPACAHMVVYDVDGDGDNDVLTTAAHEYGVWWFEQQQENGAAKFVQHEIDRSMSQTHALILADINNDGLQDLVTGKRYYAHCGKDPGANEPAVLCWFELKRTEPGKFEYLKHEIDANSGVGTQFEVCDFDADGLLDIVTSNKKGVHVFLQRRSK